MVFRLVQLKAWEYICTYIFNGRKENTFYGDTETHNTFCAHFAHLKSIIGAAAKAEKLLLQTAISCLTCIWMSSIEKNKINPGEIWSIKFKFAGMDFINPFFCCSLFPKFVRFCSAVFWNLIRNQINRKKSCSRYESRSILLCITIELLMLWKRRGN